MPILDHFHPPLYPTHTWESFHMRWATVIADTLDRILPRRFFAEVHTHLGTEVAADIAELEQRQGAPDDGANGPAGGVAVQTWSPPTVTMVLPFTFPDDLEVRVRDERDDARLVAVVELVSPRNKDRPDARRAFAAKCAAYLQCGIGVIVADIVTTRSASLHNELIDLLHLDAVFRLGADVMLAAQGYRPIRRNDQDQVDTWAVPLEVGGTLPVLPLSLRGTGLVPLDLEATYSETRQRCRL